MAQPASRSDLINYCKRQLGAPVLEINVAEEQIDDLIDDALQYFHERHFDGVTQTLLKYKITEADINRYDLAQFKNWKCRHLMYHIDMAGRIANHCTEEEYTILDMKMEKLSKCVDCPLQRCNCDTKFLYVKTNPSYEE